MNKLLQARKAWKVFINRIQSKIHKLNRSKTIKNRLNKPSKRISWPALCVQHKRFKSKPKKPSKTLGLYHTNHFQKKPSVVYIDQLSIEPVSVVKKHVQQSSIKANKVYKKETPSSSGKKEELRNSERENMAATVEEDSADDMWESLALASPQMNGINERAEEFITRFRAGMRQEERLARLL